MRRRELRDVLSSIVALDLDAILAYEQAIVRIRRDAIARRELAEFKGDHARHVRELGAIVRRMGGKAPVRGDVKRFVTQGRVVLASALGDTAILRAMRANEDATNAAYDAALGEPGVSDDVRGVLERGLQDERRHRAWIETHLRSQRAAA